MELQGDKAMSEEKTVTFTVDQYRDDITKAYRMGFQAAIDTLQDVAEFLVDKTKMANVINGALDMAALVEDKYYLRDKINNRQERA